MFRVLSDRTSFIVTCKHCRRLVPTGHSGFPFHSIVVTCTLCGEPDRYPPSEIRRGRAEKYVAVDGQVWRGAHASGSREIAPQHR